MSNFIGGLKLKTCGRKIRRLPRWMMSQTTAKGSLNGKRGQTDERRTGFTDYRDAAAPASIESELVLESGRVEFKANHRGGLSFTGEVSIPIEKLGRNSTSCLEIVYKLFFVYFHSDNHPEVVYMRYCHFLHLNMLLALGDVNYLVQVLREASLSLEVGLVLLVSLRVPGVGVWDKPCQRVAVFCLRMSMRIRQNFLFLKC